MGTSTEKSPKQITIRGRLSFPSFTAQEAFDLSQKGSYPAKSVAEAKPSFQLVVERDQLDRFRDHCVDTFLPYCAQQQASGEKRDALEQSEVDDIVAQINDMSKWDKGVYNTPFKTVHEKTAEMAPEAAATIKLIGTAGVDIELMAVVTEESELKIPDPDVLKYPIMRDLDETKHSMYPGAIVACTVNLYAYHNGKLPGFSAGVSKAVFRADADRFGGGVAVDEDEIFMD